MLAACVGALFAALPGHARDKTDVIVLKNGDHVTGEIKTLEYGLLALSTDHMGTIEIEWASVASVESSVPFDVERIGGLRTFGTLAAGENELVVNHEGRSESVPLAEVTRLAVIERGFWERVNGTLSLGYNYTKSNGIAVGNIAMSSQYQGERVRATVDFSANRSSSPGTETTEQAQAASTVQFLSDRPRFLILLNSIETNEQLGIERRIQSGAAMARYLRQSPDSEITGLAGVVLNNEWTTTADDDRQHSVEGVLGAQWRIFRFREPDVSLSAQAALYPSLTESGRYRTGLNVTLQRDLVKDFTINLTLYQSYDSDPPDAEDGSDNSDYGIVTSLGYKF